MQVTWEAVTAVCAIVALIEAVQIKVIQGMIRTEINALNGRYVRAELCCERHNACRADLVDKLGALIERQQRS